MLMPFLLPVIMSLPCPSSPSPFPLKNISYENALHVLLHSIHPYVMLRMLTPDFCRVHTVEEVSSEEDLDIPDFFQE